MTPEMNRRDFVKHSAVAGLGVGIVGAPTIARGRNLAETLSVAVVGVNSRGLALAESFATATDSEVIAICDVDSRARDGCVATVAGLQDRAPRGLTDFRRTLDDPDVDAIVIAMPDHWHMPAALMALKAGKHVYLEKPCSHNPREGELLVEAEAKYGRVMQMGNQQRSAPESIEVISEIHAGLIGRPYFARAWYANTRGPIGNGVQTAVPDWLDYELWQGPAPRTPYRDNVVHYNWHWFWRWGSGEVNNNGTHEIDVCRWALDVEYPTRVTSSGGRFHYDDDWEFYDTQVCSFEFEAGKSITWEGRSCNGRPVEGRGRGASIHGENGTVGLRRGVGKMRPLELDGPAGRLGDVGEMTQELALASLVNRRGRRRFATDARQEVGDVKIRQGTAATGVHRGLGVALDAALPRKRSLTNRDLPVVVVVHDVPAPIEHH